MPFIGVFHHQHLKHARKRQEGGRRQECQADPARPVELPGGDGRGLDRACNTADAACHAPGDKNAHRQERHQLDHGFDGDGGDHARMAFVHVQVAGAKQNGEHRQPHRHPQRGGRQVRGLKTRRPLGGKDRKGQRHRLQLQRDIGCGADHREQCHDHAQQVRFAIARRQKVGDRGDALQPAHMHQLAQHPPPADQHQGRPQINGQVFKPRARRIADRAVKGPGGAIDRQRQGIDHRAAQPARLAPACPAVGPERHREQPGHIGDGHHRQKVEGHH